MRRGTGSSVWGKLLTTISGYANRSGYLLSVPKTRNNESAQNAAGLPTRSANLLTQRLRGVAQSDDWDRAAGTQNHPLRDGADFSCAAIAPIDSAVESASGIARPGWDRSLCDD